MKRNYPLFLIDRSKASAYPFDYITCFDQAVGFVARVVHFPEDVQYFEFVKTAIQIENSEYFNITLKLKRGGIILAIEDFMHEFELNMVNQNRVKTLLKKALKKYIHAEIDRTAIDDLDIENQIKQQQLSIERAKTNYEELVSRGNKESADYSIALAEATLYTLKKFRDNQKYLTLNLN